MKKKSSKQSEKSKSSLKVADLKTKGNPKGGKSVEGGNIKAGR